MGASCCNIRLLHVFAMCLLFIFQNGTRVVYVEALYTNTLDVLGLIALVGYYPQLTESVGDPCYPVKYTWIECSDDYESRVVALNLGGRNLIGQLVDFSSLNALEIIDLHGNSLSGPIPAFLGNFYHLKSLNLANNQFTGPIPSSLANKNIIKDFSGNPGLGSSNPSPPGSSTSPTYGSNISPPAPYGSGSNYPPLTNTYQPNYNYSPPEEKKDNKLPVIFGISIPSILIPVVVGVIATYKQKRRAQAAIAAAAAAAAGGGGLA